MEVTCAGAPPPQRRRDSTERKSKKIFLKVISRSPSLKKNNFEEPSYISFLISRKTCPAPTFALTLALPDPRLPIPLLRSLTLRDKGEILHKEKHRTKSAEWKCQISAELVGES